ncbi:Tripartite tricarboxylate transporter substrate binding protein [Bordetella tumbae]|uniref:Bug family tripartite tricarboxylate transporter substrate binding protein n=1 Tax=Bordetella tumbae TaxID=1649139 RepID=UPI0039F049A4
MTDNTRRALLLGSAALLFTPLARAQTSYPARPIRILVGFAAGGGVDTVTRLYAQKLSDLLKTPVIVENKPGASELLAVQALLNSQPDGYTLWMSSASGLVRNPSVRSDIPYDPLKDLTFISRVAEVEALYVVRPGLPVNSVSDLVKYAKEHPGKLNYGSAGVGSSNHLLTEQLKMLTGIDMVHVPFKSDAEVARELAAGTLDFAIAITTFTVPFVKDGRLKAIAVTGSRRLDDLPDVPTLDESEIPQIHGLGNYLFYGLAGPAGLPPAIVKTLNDGLNTAAGMPETVQTLQKARMQAVTSSPPDVRQFVEKEVNNWKKIGKTIKIEAY